MDSPQTDILLHNYMSMETDWQAMITHKIQTETDWQILLARPSPSCYYCGGPHLAPACLHIDKVCRYSKKEGHLAKVCRAKARARTRNDSQTSASSSKVQPNKKPNKKSSTIPQKITHYVQEEPEKKDSSSEDEYSLNVIHSHHGHVTPLITELGLCRLM